MNTLTTRTATRPLSTSTTRTLAFAEYEFARLELALGELKDTIAGTVAEFSASADAVRLLVQARKLVRKALANIDEPLTAAIQAEQRS